jgi:regulator of extracellular matrix RemA (YlzA/DUF370 family)
MPKTIADYSIATLDAGFGNVVPKNRIVGIVAYDSDPMRRHCQELEKLHRVIDATKGRRVKSVIFLDSSHIVLSSVARETLCERLSGKVESLAEL